MKEEFFSLMHGKNYLHSIKVSFLILLIFNLLYVVLGFSTIMFFNQYIFVLFSAVRFIAFFVVIAAYSFVTWNIVNKHKGTVIDSAVAAVILSLLVFATSQLIGFIGTSLIFWNATPESLISATPRTHFVEQYLSVTNVMMGLILGLVIPFIGGFFGFITSEIQTEFTPRVKSILLSKRSHRHKAKHMKLLAKDVKIFAVLRTKTYLKKLNSFLKQIVHTRKDRKKLPETSESFV